MFKKLLSNIILILSLFIGTISSNLHAQKTVFSDNFSTSFGENFTPGGQNIGASKWAVTSSGNGGYSARIHAGVMTITNNGLRNGVANGWVLASRSTIHNAADPTSYNADYKTTLNQNAGIVSWTFNIRQSYPTPNGFGGGEYGVAYVLAGTNMTSNAVGQGYAIQIGTSSGNESLRLVRYTNGMSNAVTILSSQSNGPTKVGYSFMSVRVEYNPQTEEWKLFARVDANTSNASTSNFKNPSEVLPLKAQGTHANSYTNIPLPITGGFWNAGNTSNDAFIDNVEVKVVVPEIISITPSSTTAGFQQFTLTVTGKNFKNGDVIYWNGSLRTTTFNSDTQLSTQILATDIATAGTANVTVKRGTTFTTNSVPFTILVPGTPTLLLPNTTLAKMQTTQGTPSAPQSYTISATDLTTAVTVTAPNNFEISLSEFGQYFNTLSLEKQGGNAGGLLGTPVTIYARLTGVTAGVFSGNISHAATGAITKNVAVSGRVMANEPLTPASTILFSNISSTSFRVDWTNGNGENRLLIVKKASAVNALISDGSTYFEGATFGTGSDLGTGNFVVYKGSGNAVTVTGLEPSTNYHVSVIEFNGPAGAENYRSAHVPGNTTTLNDPVGLQLFAADTSYKINFDQTVDGVNVNRFEGSGINPDPTVGQLDSDAWAFKGFTGGDLPFGGTSPDNSSYEMGISTGNVSSTGIYGFNVGTEIDENYTLGIQPGGSDFNPGTITLKIQNQTGAAISSLNIGYKVYVYNDQEASTIIRFSHSSSNEGSYTDQAIVDVISPESADLAPEWKAYYRSAKITAVIAKDAFYYIRWRGSFYSGNGSQQDEFGIDDIEVIASNTTPATKVVSFGGVAEDFVLQGDATLSTDLSVQNRLHFNGGKLAITDKTLTIAGKVENYNSNGLIGGPTSKLVVRGTQNPTLSFDQTAGANIFSSFSLIGANPNTVTASNNFSVNDILSVDEQQILNLGTNILSGDLTSILNNGIIQTQNTTATPFTPGKTWGGTGILNMNAVSTAQTLVAGTYTNLTLSSTAGTTAAANLTVNGILDLPAANSSAFKGSLDLATNTLLMGPGGTNTGIGDVTGIIKRDFFTINKLYTFGHPNTSITFPPAGTPPTSMSIKLTIGDAPTWRPGSVERSVDIIQTGGSGTKAIIRQHYLDSEMPDGKSETKLVFWVNRIGLTPEPIFEQGRSSNNTGDNWVEITNANVAQYFVSTFGTVFITLDESKAPVLIWNGFTSNSWTTSTNWTPAATPSSSTKVIIPNVASLPHQPLLNPTGEVGSIVIESGGILNSPAEAQLTMFGAAGAWQNNGIFNPGNGTSNVIFNNIDATISGSTTFNNLTIASGAGIRPADGNFMSIAGTLTNNGTMFTTLIPNTIEFVGANQTIPAPGGELFGGYHNLIVSGTGATIFAPAISTLNVRGNLTLNQNVPFTGITVNLAGISDQTIGGTSAINFNNLIVNKETGAVLLAQDINVDGTLTLTKGNVVLGANNLTLGSAAVAGTFGNNSMIVADGAGMVRRPFAGLGSYLFPIGEFTGAPCYSPITVNITAAESFASAFVAVNARDIKHPNNYSTQNFIRHYWNVQQTGITGAKATIIANYETLDINGPEDQIAAAQLTGTFDVQTNPWIKFVPFVLGSNTLIATYATLQPGQTSVFTGLKGGLFSVEVEGYGDFCKGSVQKMNAVTSGGDAPYTYAWTPTLANAALVTIPTAIVGTINYTLKVTDANGFVASDDNSPVTIFPASVGGTIAAPTQNICVGNIPADIVLNGSIGSVLYWQKSNLADFATFENLSIFTTTLSGTDIGPLIEPTYFRAAIKSGNCGEVFSDSALITFASTTWEGTPLGWSNGEPIYNISAIFAADYTATASIKACSIVVNNNAVVTIPAGFDVTVNGAITVAIGASLTFESNTNLIQLTDAVNSGAISVKRNSSPLYRLDYTMWGSPVTGSQTLKQFTPATFSNRFYKYNFLKYLFEPINPEVTFTPATGYLIRMPDNHISYGGTNQAQTWPGTFTGVPNNGTINVALNSPPQGFNMISNPYPSMIDANEFLTANSAEIDGTLYFWRRRNSVPVGTEGTTAYYATYTVAGGTATGAASTSTNTNGTFVSQIPNGFIQVGQGFLVSKKAGITGNATFTNAMRTKNNTNQFFRTANKDKRSRIWLNVSNTNGEFGQTLIAYMPSADNGVDRSDGKYINDGSTALTSWLDNYEYIIQGRAPFTATDVVALNFKTLTAGNYTIAIDHVDGLFTGEQDVFLRDKLTGVTHNLKTSVYTFATQAGSFNSRFEIMYINNTLSTENPLLDSNKIVLYKKDNRLIINSGKVVIDHVEVFDISGKLLIERKKINSNEVSINVGQTNQILIVKITSTDGVTVNMKTIN